jgi:signal transduction histidine kinase/Flp pilus assembly protein TadD
MSTGSVWLFVTPCKTIMISLLLMGCLASPLKAQETDSLRAMIERMPPDTNLVLMLNTLAQRLTSREPAQAIVHAREALALAEKLSWKHGIAEAQNTMGALHTNAGEYEKALTSFQRCLEIYRDEENGSGMARALRNIGVVQRRIGNTEEALDYTKQSMEVARAQGDSLSYAKALVNLGNIENQTKHYERALGYFQRCRGIFRQAGDRFGESSVLNGMGNAYAELDRLSEALQMYEQSLEINRERGDTRAVASIRINVGDIHVQRGDWGAAIREFTAALSDAEIVGARDLSRMASKRLARCHAQRGEYKLAYQYYDKHVAIRDSTFDETVLHQVNLLTRKYEGRQREQHIALLEAEKELQSTRLARETLIRNYSIAGFVIITVFAFWVVFLARKRKRTNIDLRNALATLQRTQDQLIHSEKMATLGKVSAGVAHEIRNPLNFIINFADLSISTAKTLESAVAKDKELLEEYRLLVTNLEKIGGYGRRAENIVTGMVQHAEGGTGVPESTDLNALLRRGLELARQASHQDAKDLQYSLEMSFDASVGNILLIPREMTRVVFNLFQNAIDALLARKQGADPSFHPTIAVSTKMLGDSVEIRFHDNGCGIAQDALRRVFEPFYTSRSTGTGTGLGLSITYDIIVEGHGGHISVESVNGSSTDFIITLPKRTE